MDIDVEFWINYPQMLPITKKMVRFLFSPRTLPLELQLIFFYTSFAAPKILKYGPRRGVKYKPRYEVLG